MVRRRFFSAVSNHEAPWPILRDAQPDSAGALPGERAPQDEADYGRRRRVAALATASCRVRCGEPPYAIAHIGFLFSCLVDVGQLSFLGRSPDSIFYAPS
jgi:hypothetical protein